MYLVSIAVTLVAIVYTNMTITWATTQLITWLSSVFASLAIINVNDSENRNSNNSSNSSIKELEKVLKVS
jgi:hypothetical protein